MCLNGLEFHSLSGNNKDKVLGQIICEGRKSSRAKGQIDNIASNAYPINEENLVALLRYHSDILD